MSLRPVNGMRVHVAVRGWCGVGFAGHGLDRRPQLQPGQMADRPLTRA